MGFCCYRKREGAFVGNENGVIPVIFIHPISMASSVECQQRVSDQVIKCTNRLQDLEV